MNLFFPSQLVGLGVINRVVRSAKRQDLIVLLAGDRVAQIPSLLGWLRTMSLGRVFGASSRCAGRAMPWLLMLYAAASLWHFAHNAEYLAQYPNLPASWSRAEVYIAWCCVTAPGIIGYVLYRRGYRDVGLILLGLYACLGFGGLLHYARAKLTDHSVMMNVTIWTEAAAAGLLLMSLASVAIRDAKHKVLGRGDHRVT